MIVSMQRARLLGPLAALPDVLTTVQDVGCLHLVPGPSDPGLRTVEPDRRWRRHVAQLRSILDDVEETIAALPAPSFRAADPPDGAASDADLPRIARFARRLRRELRRLERRRRDLDEDSQRLEIYRDLARALPESERRAAGRGHTFALVLERPVRRVLSRLQSELASRAGDDFELRSISRDDGGVALLITVPAERAKEIEAAVKATGTRELELPPGFGGETLLDALPGLRSRWRRLDDERRALGDELQRLSDQHGDELRRARSRLHDRLATLEVLPKVRRSERAFVLEGWIPASDLQRLRHELAARCDPAVVVEVLHGGRAEDLGTDDGAAESAAAPVELSNPAMFRPFEVLIRPMSLPRYGSLDPTPFVAVFLPMFFGLILGDVGYGLVLAALGLVLGGLFPEGSRPRMVGQIALSCALFTVIFGYLFGELFGDIGQRMGWMEPLLFDREEAVLPFLMLAVSLGFVHLLLGLILGLIAAWRGERRRALGRGLAAAMLVFTAAALLALWQVIPREILTPSVVLLVIAFPVLVGVEGLAAPLEVLSTFGRVLSYARIMAIGSASVMLAVVANEMAGAFGSVVVGVVFALLFHLVNFALGLFSPTIHALRLHYVEFFGTFYTPGGDRFRPLAHWRADDAAA